MSATTVVTTIKHVCSSLQTLQTKARSHGIQDARLDAACQQWAALNASGELAPRDLSVRRSARLEEMFIGEWGRAYRRAYDHARNVAPGGWFNVVTIHECLPVVSSVLGIYIFVIR